MASVSKESLLEIISGDLLLRRWLFSAFSGDRMGKLGGAHDEEPEGEPVEDHRLRRVGGAGHESRCSCRALPVLMEDAASGLGQLIMVVVLAVPEMKEGARM